MPKLSKHSIRLYEGDLDRLAGKYPLSGPTKALRQLLHNYLNRVDREAPQTVTVELEDQSFGPMQDTEIASASD